MKKYFILGFLLFFSYSLNAQELQSEFETLVGDPYASRYERLDGNEDACAVLRVSVSDASKYKFSGNIIGDIIYGPGEAIIYMAARSRTIRISSDKFGTHDYEFPERLQSKVSYRLTLKVILSEAQKTRTLVMPVMGIGKAPSYGIMLGIVKKWGAYAKVMHSFNSLSTDLTCDESGNIGGDSQKGWFTGEKENSRFSITGGVMYRVALPVYFYLGAGYGYKKLGWETEGGKWAEVSNHSTKGLETEFGVICRIKNFALSAGVQNNQFKNWDAIAGAAFMF